MARFHQSLVDGLQGHVDDRHSGQLETKCRIAHLAVQGVHGRLVGGVRWRRTSDDVTFIQRETFPSRHMKLRREREKEREMTNNIIVLV